MKRFTAVKTKTDWLVTITDRRIAFDLKEVLTLIKQEGMEVKRKEKNENETIITMRGE